MLKLLVVSNVTALPEGQPDGIRRQLVQQLTSPVRWVESMQYLLSLGIRTFVEIGPGTVLKGLMRKIEPTAEVVNIQTTADVTALASVNKTSVDG